ncbi:multicopper oxidase family protein [Cohnella nanjingensis]|uniref:Multicopper oxidase family protein n=1 Tax=Cohnella nanjingensis TaxID=1387779 RepID=A0A7X0VI14_9BACL|nr:multicopper oxidase family protein [Cohnella nanjingensis]MBB6674486.1 multicopper oxidase family protein [Cohnella nanjingensis]
MFITFSSILLAFAMTVLWSIASLIVTWLPYVKNNKYLKIGRNSLLWVSWIAIVICLAWCIMIGSVLIFGEWIFVEGIIKAVAPVMVITHLTILISTLPKWRSIRDSNKEKLAPHPLLTVTHPMVTLPVYAAALASGMNALGNIFAQPVLPSPLEIASRPLLIVLILFVPAIFVIRRYKAVLKGEFVLHKLWRRMIKLALTGALTAAVVIAVGAIVVLSGVNSSRLPEASDMMNHVMDDGGGSPIAHSSHPSGHHSGHNRNMPSNASDTVEVAALTGDISAPADIKFELVAQMREVTLASGAKIEAWTYNGEIAPELRARYGDMVEVKLINKDIAKGVTIHWHGYNVPNAMDGVPGMTQNVVKPGESFTYKFRAEQEGTYWFHSHQQASEQVEKGLFGSLIVESRQETEIYDEAFTIINHQWVTNQGDKTAFGNQDLIQMKKVEPGKKIKLRIINTHNQSRKYLLQGVDYQITSMDGMRIQKPDLLTDRTAFRLASGGRYDVVFTMPDGSVLFKLGDYKNDEDPGIIFYEDTPPANPSFKKESNLFDPSQYGEPVINELTSDTEFDRQFKMILGNKMGFYDGKIQFLWTINGEVYPNIPTFMVKEGEKIKTTFINKSITEHPMHLHGHHMTVLKKNGKKVMTPWLTDTLNVYAGETYEVAFIADNPGMWMDHCHNLEHAKTGMILHLMYDNVSPSYEVGTRSGNLPE